MTGAVEVRADDGPGPGDIPITLTPGLVLTLLVVVVVLLLLLMLGLWWGWRRLRRSPALRRGMLRARAAALEGRGIAGELAALRLRLDDALSATDRVMTEVYPGEVTSGLPALTDELRQAGGELSGWLRLLEDEPDPRYVARVLPATQARVDQVVSGLLQVRETALRLATDLGPVDDTTLAARVADTVAGLNAGIDEMRALRGRPR